VPSIMSEYKTTAYNKLSALMLMLGQAAIAAASLESRVGAEDIWPTVFHPFVCNKTNLMAPHSTLPLAPEVFSCMSIVPLTRIRGIGFAVECHPEGRHLAVWGYRSSRVTLPASKAHCEGLGDPACKSQDCRGT